MSNWVAWVSTFVAAAVASYFLVLVTRKWARRRLLDVPNERSSHSVPTPRGGGLAIDIVTLAGLACAWVVIPSWSASFIPVYILAALLIAVVSWWDDLHSLPASARFAVHAVGAFLFIFSTSAWSTVALPLLGPVQLGWLGLAFAFVWIVAFTSIYNFMDGIDGIAGSQALIAGFAWVALTVVSAQAPVTAIGLLVAASSLGFLFHNWPPARIFMGDVGSAFLGFTFAALPVAAANSDPKLAFAGLLLVWPFIFDGTFTILRRLRQGENIFQAHRTHLYQRLVIAGYTHQTVTLIYAGLAATGGILAAAWIAGLPGAELAIALLTPAMALGLWWSVVARENTASLQARNHEKKIN